MPGVPNDSGRGGDEGSAAISVLFLCTGNAARSVIAGAALGELRPDLIIATAGTLTVDGLPISWRTRAALDEVGLSAPRHASRQAEAIDLYRSDLVIALAPEHVRWVRREHAEMADRTSTLARLTRQLDPPDPSLAGVSYPERSIGERLAPMRLAAVELEPWEEVVDPGGGEVDAFVRCAREIVVLVDRLARLL